MKSVKMPIVALCTILTFVSLIVFRGNVLHVLAAVVALGAIMLVANWSLEHLVVYIALLLIGIVIEILSVAQGLWIYPSQTIFGIPLWIPFMWANGGLFVVELKESVDRILEKWT